MKLVADIHLHSHYSRATSKNLTFEHLWKWAQLKGVQVVATGDIAHPGWLQELQEKLEPAEDGLFQLKSEYTAAVADELPATCRGTVRFLIGGEISNIYKKFDRTRKVHNIVFAPSVDATVLLQAELEKIGNIRSDGRPILGLDSRDLLEIVLEVDDRCHLVPAHIWTPWFSLLGSMSGFDSLNECFGDLSSHIFAVETGLSSDPPMNWRVSWLDNYTLISNSDAHSPPKLAREATLFDTDLCYDALFDALRSRDPSQFLGTIEFFPEEGKYHLDGHRKCGVCWEPVTTVANKGLCPTCGRPVTVGVYHRVAELADRDLGFHPPSAAPFASLIPLPEALSELLGVGPNSKRVQAEYLRLLGRLGPELTILRESPLEDIGAAGTPLLAEGIRRMRAGEVHTQSGYDGEYGVIRMFADEFERNAFVQIGMFAEEPAPKQATQDIARPAPAAPPAEAPPPPPKEPQTQHSNFTLEETGQYTLGLDLDATQPLNNWLQQLNDEQRAAASHTDSPLAIVAGPGTGKTRTLTVRIAHLVRNLNAPPSSILALTFTNRAAEEMRERLQQLLGDERAAQVTVATFHRLAAELIHDFGASIGISPAFTILAEEDRRRLLSHACPELSARELRSALDEISARKNGIENDSSPGDTPALDHNVWQRYQAALSKAGALDFDDLVLRALQLLETDPSTLQTLHARYRWISVDEYQDVNTAQYRLLRKLAGPGANLCVIGDPDQAIYGFRGADHRFFLSFAEDFPGAQRLSLERNYRSAQAILDAAAQVIARNPDHQAAELIANFADQIKLDVYRAPTDRAEAEYVVHQVEQMVGGTSYFSLDSGRLEEGGPPEDRTFGDFAVLYRLNAQGTLLEEAFDRSGIPFETVGGTSLTEQKPVREIMALLWLTQKRENPVHWDRILKGSNRALSEGSVVELVEDLVESASAQVAERIQAVAPGWARLRGAKYSDAERARIDRIKRRAAPFRNRMQDFLTTMALQGETDHYDQRADRVTLMSLHAAKGLEFPVVFIVGCEEGLLPYLPANRDTNIEEERRLFYVGMTRAQRRLFLTHAARRFLFGQSMENRVSSFVTDIAVALQEVRQPQPRRSRPKAEDRQLRLI